MNNARLAKAEKIIDNLLTWALANRNSKYEFVNCYTYGYNHQKKKSRCPKALADAKKFMRESTKHLIILKDK